MIKRSFTWIVLIALVLIFLGCPTPSNPIPDDEYRLTQMKVFNPDNSLLFLFIIS